MEINVLFTTGELDEAGEDVVFTPDDFYEHLNHVIYQVIVSSLCVLTVMEKHSFARTLNAHQLVKTFPLLILDFIMEFTFRVGPGFHEAFKF